MANINFEEDPLDHLLDHEAQASFGYPFLGDSLEPGARSSVSGALSAWNAEDFSNIYVRFRPHLVRHAKRYMSDPHIAEELVQEAFLYLLTALPELDSELGVLKFLKWKIKYLAYDYLRSSVRNNERQTDNFAESLTVDGEIGAELEAAEDATIIRQALAKLSPRHRNVLLANVYEEKSVGQIAQELNMESNATRQLIFRARKAFRIALVGEAEVAGKPVSEVISLAVKKAARDARNNIGVISSVGLLFVLSFSGVASIPSNDQDSQTDLVSAVAGREANGPVEAANPNTVPDIGSINAETAPLFEGSTSKADSATPRDLQLQTEDQSFAEEFSAIDETPLDTGSEPEGNKNDFSSSADFEIALATDISEAGFYSNSYTAYLSNVFTGTSIEVFGGTGISAFVDYIPSSASAEHVFVQIWVEGELLLGIPEKLDSVASLEDGVSSIFIEAENFNVVDGDMNIYRDTPLAESRVSLVILVNQEGQVTQASMTLSSKTDQP